MAANYITEARILGVLRAIEQSRLPVERCVISHENKTMELIMHRERSDAGETAAVALDVKSSWSDA